jgi:hypothetical protein
VEDNRSTKFVTRTYPHGIKGLKCAMKTGIQQLDKYRFIPLAYEEVLLMSLKTHCFFNINAL